MTVNDIRFLETDNKAQCYQRYHELKCMTVSSEKENIVYNRYLKKSQNKELARERLPVILECKDGEMPEYDLASHILHSSPREVYIGRFIETRKTLDRSFHGCYTEARQLVQDSILENIVKDRKNESRPVIIFTSGTMGAGKTTTVNSFQVSGILGESFVTIDQDHLRSQLPEWENYLKRQGERAGALLQRESGYLAEIALKETLACSQNIIFDSSLRDTSWWESRFKHIRQTYPQYRIVILNIRTNLETAISRAQLRATGRICPEEIVRDSYFQYLHAFECLRNLADFTAVVDNSELPVFVDESASSLEHFIYYDT